VVVVVVTMLLLLLLLTRCVAVDPWRGGAIPVQWSWLVDGGGFPRRF
jgi:hypothetical protein